MTARQPSCGTKNLPGNSMEHTRSASPSSSPSSSSVSWRSEEEEDGRLPSPPQAAMSSAAALRIEPSRLSERHHDAEPVVLPPSSSTSSSDDSPATSPNYWARWQQRRRFKQAMRCVLPPGLSPPPPPLAVNAEDRSGVPPLHAVHESDGVSVTGVERQSVVAKFGDHQSLSKHGDVLVTAPSNAAHNHHYAEGPAVTQSISGAVVVEALSEPPPSLSLLSLPVEVVRHVAEYLSTACVISSVARVSRHFLHIVIGPPHQPADTAWRRRWFDLLAVETERCSSTASIRRRLICEELSSPPSTTESYRVTARCGVGAAGGGGGFLHDWECGSSHSRPQTQNRSPLSTATERWPLKKATHYYETMFLCSRGFDCATPERGVMPSPTSTKVRVQDFDDPRTDFREDVRSIARTLAANLELVSMRGYVDEKSKEDETSGAILLLPVALRRGYGVVCPWFDVFDSSDPACVARCAALGYDISSSDTNVRSGAIPPLRPPLPAVPRATAPESIASASNSSSPSPLLVVVAPRYSATHLAWYDFLLSHGVMSDVRKQLWSDEMKFATCTTILSPTGAAAEVRFFANALEGSYPKFVAKCVAAPASSTARVFPVAEMCDVHANGSCAELFCGGYGRVEVDIAPRVSVTAFGALRDALELPIDFPLPLLWNVVVAFTDVELLESHILNFLLTYQSTFELAVERAVASSHAAGRSDE